MNSNLDLYSSFRAVVQFGAKFTAYTSFVIIVVFVCTYSIHRLSRRRQMRLPGIPLISSPKSGDFRTVIHEANEKYSDQPYIVPFQDPTVIIPPHCIEELKNLPDSQISPNGSMYDRFAIRWTNSGWVDKELAHSIKYDLANEVDGFFATIQDEIVHATDSSLPSSDSWSSKPPQDALVKIVGPVIGRLMVGSPLNRDKKWLTPSIDHAIAVVVYSAWLRQIPPILKPIFAHILPQKRAVEASKTGISNSINPIIEKQLADGKDIAGVHSEEGRLIRWLLRRYKPFENPRFDPSLVLRDHYSLCFAAIHGPTFLLVQALIDLASYPKYMNLLRKEVDRELRGAPFEKWTRQIVGKMKLLDAFCKESARMNPQGIIAWLRKSHKPINLSTGHTIPANTLIAATNPRYNTRATPWIVDPEKFYPERWLQDQKDTSPDANWKFGSATTDSLIFGYGKHACPGRPFGVTVVKDILAYIVSKWDVRLSGGLKERPENICMDFAVMPPIAPLGNLEIEFKLRG